MVNALHWKKEKKTETHAVYIYLVNFQRFPQPYQFTATSPLNLRIPEPLVIWCSANYVFLTDKKCFQPTKTRKNFLHFLFQVFNPRLLLLLVLMERINVIPCDLCTQNYFYLESFSPFYFGYFFFSIHSFTKFLLNVSVTQETVCDLDTNSFPHFLFRYATEILKWIHTHTCNRTHTHTHTRAIADSKRS